MIYCFSKGIFHLRRWLDVAEKVLHAVESQTFRCQSLILAACSDVLNAVHEECRIGPLSTCILYLKTLLYLVECLNSWVF